MSTITKTPAEAGVKDKQIVASENKIVNFDPEADVERAKIAAKALMKVIDITKPLIMNGKRYLYFEHWQTVAKFFNSTVGIDRTEQTEKGYIAKAVVYNKEGVIIGGAEASCMQDELNWKTKPDFQLRSMAQTRAMAKALRSIYGFVAVLAGVEATPAEEINGKEMEKPKTYDSKKPTEKQKAYIKQLCRQKGITQTQVKELVIDHKTPSQLIDFLVKYQPEQFHELDEGLQKIVDETEF
jgi:hypothetical protein